MRASVRCGGRTVPCRSFLGLGPTGTGESGTNEWLSSPAGADRPGSGLTASSPLRRAPRCRSRWREVDMIPGTSGRRPTNQHRPQGAVLLSLSDDAGRLGRLGLVTSTTIRFCTVYSAGARGIADSGLAGSLQPLASWSTHRASMAWTGRQAANGEPFGDEAGHSVSTGHSGRVARWVSTEQPPAGPPMRWNRQAGGRHPRHRITGPRPRRACFCRWHWVSTEWCCKTLLAWQQMLMTGHAHGLDLDWISSSRCISAR